MDYRIDDDGFIHFYREQNKFQFSFFPGDIVGFLFYQTSIDVCFQGMTLPITIDINNTVKNHILTEWKIHK